MDLSTAGALVTGGSRGIGRETARALIERGASVVICGRDTGSLEEAAADLGAHPVRADVSREEDVERLVGTAVEELDDYDVLINNAGIGAHAPLVDTTVEDMRRVWETNVLGATLVARASARHFVERGGGNIVNVGSTSGRRGYPGGTAYVSSKFALRGMSECWRSELRTSDVRVMHVDPSEVQTGFGRGSGDADRASNPTKLRPTEIAHAIVSLLEMDDRGFIPELSVWATNPR
jgi:3-oxoacyl-[acyl-carrier protein] reductase